jgi:hypothetical protein
MKFGENNIGEYVHTGSQDEVLAKVKEQMETSGLYYPSCHIPGTEVQVEMHGDVLASQFNIRRLKLNQSLWCWG